MFRVISVAKMTTLVFYDKSYVLPHNQYSRVLESISDYCVFIADIPLYINGFNFQSLFSCVFRPRWEDICAFRAFPNKCQTSFQLCELVDDYIQEEIRKPPTQETCSVCCVFYFLLYVSHI